MKWHCFGHGEGESWESHASKTTSVQTLKPFSHTSNPVQIYQRNLRQHLVIDLWYVVGENISTNLPGTLQNITLTFLLMCQWENATTSEALTFFQRQLWTSEVMSVWLLSARLLFGLLPDPRRPVILQPHYSFQPPPRSLSLCVCTFMC